MSSIARIKASSQKAKEKQIEDNSKKISSNINYKTVNARVVKKNPPNENSEKNINISEMIAKAKQKAANISSSARLEGVLPVGTRVFHTHFGVGKIVNINKDDKQQSYVVDFTKAGEKILDVASSGLKTF